MAPRRNSVGSCTSVAPSRDLGWAAVKIDRHTAASTDKICRARYGQTADGSVRIATAHSSVCAVTVTATTGCASSSPKVLLRKKYGPKDDADARVMKLLTRLGLELGPSQYLLRHQNVDSPHSCRDEPEMVLQSPMPKRRIDGHTYVDISTTVTLARTSPAKCSAPQLEASHASCLVTVTTASGNRETKKSRASDIAAHVSCISSFLDAKSLSSLGATNSTLYLKVAVLPVHSR